MSDSDLMTNDGYPSFHLKTHLDTTIFILVGTISVIISLFVCMILISIPSVLFSTVVNYYLPRQDFWELVIIGTVFTSVIMFIGLVIHVALALNDD